MTGNGTRAFFEQAYRNNWHQYLASTREDAPGGWDLCVLTASDERQARLARTLGSRPRPFLVGNPDVSAPRVGGFSLEPGHYSHRIADLPRVDARFFGKPFANAFDAVRRRLGQAVDGARVAMVGDSLHTDILGGAAAGFRTVLVTGHGVFSGLHPGAWIERTGIVPDFIIETT